MYINYKKKSLLSFITFISFTMFTYAQIDPSLKEGLKYKLNEDGTHWIKMNMTSQFWLRSNDNNPGSAISNGNNSYAVPTSMDASIRRMRFVVSGQITDHLSFFIQWGQNSINPLTPRKGLEFFHDINLEYAVVPKYFVLGGGIVGWDGPGRYGNASTTSIMGIDLPVYQQTEADITEQDVRKLGFYAKGKLEKLDYRISVCTPFALGITQIPGAATTIGDALNSARPILNVSTFNTIPMGATSGNVKGTGACTQGYFMYQFRDQESNFNSGVTGTYLGKKDVFNIGAGFKYTPNAMFHYTGVDSTVSHKAKFDTTTSDLVIWTVDVFYDHPLNKETHSAITVYAAYTNSNYGANYVRNVGANGPTNGTIGGSSFNGGGNAFPALGTGSNFYTQAGYKFKDGILGSQGSLQPYANFMYATYDRVVDPIIVLGVGVSWLINGHNQKFTLGIENRPIFGAENSISASANAPGTYITNSKVIDHKNQIVLQYQIAF